METLGTSHPRLWILEQQALKRQRDFLQTPCVVGVGVRVGGVSGETMSSEKGSLGRNGKCVTELQQTGQQYNIAPPMASSTPECRARDAGEDHSHLPPARKLQKAGRERLRRDQLNEQFAKLADVLDPIRPRNDKGSILAESILAVNELRAEIARMKTEHIALSDESRDLSAEKSELQEEKTHLETETGRLQDQLNQSGDKIQSALPGFHPSMAQFPYSLMMKGALPTKETISQDADQMPVSPFYAMAPFLHPAYQTFNMLGSRQPPFSHFSQPGQQIHVERPAARYPVPIHPTAVYPSKAVKASDPSVVATDLQLQTPGLTPSSTAPHSASDQEQSESTTFSTPLDHAEDVRSKALAPADEQRPSQLSLSSNSTVL